MTLVTISLTPTEAGTALDLVHERFPNRATADDHNQGWLDCLDRLRSAVRV
ncbi:SRPBCC domain-containing protein [Humibacter antri]